MTFLQSIIPKTKILQLALVDLVLLEGVPCHISARDSCQSPTEVANRECDSLLLLIKANIVRPQSLLCKPRLDKADRALLVQTKNLLR